MPKKINNTRPLKSSDVSLKEDFHEEVVVEKGDQVAGSSAGKIILSKNNIDHAKAMEALDICMKRYNHTLTELAK